MNNNQKPQARPLRPPNNHPELGEKIDPGRQLLTSPNAEISKLCTSKCF